MTNNNEIMKELMELDRNMSSQVAFEKLMELGHIINQYEAAIKLATHDMLFFNTSWWDKENPNELVFSLICSDTFGYSVADCEPIRFDEIPYMWDMYKAEGYPFILKKIAIKRNEKFIPEVEKRIKEYKHEKIKELKIDYNNDTENKPNFKVKLLEKACRLSANDLTYFYEKDGKILISIWNNEKKNFYCIKWEDLINIDDVQKYCNENDLMEVENGS